MKETKNIKIDSHAWWDMENKKHIATHITMETASYIEEIYIERDSNGNSELLSHNIIDRNIKHSTHRRSKNERN